MLALERELSRLVPARDGVADLRVDGGGFVAVEGRDAAEDGEAGGGGLVHGRVVGAALERGHVVVDVVDLNSDGQVLGLLK